MSVTGFPKQIDQDRLLHILDRDEPVLASFDPAIKNFGVRIEKRYKDATRDTLYYARWTLKGDTYADLIARLQEIGDLLGQCKLIVSERQMPVNYQMVRMSQHLITSLHFIVPETPIVELTASVKDAWLGKGDVKKLSIEKATQLLDEEGLKILRSNKKKDDLADTVSQVEGLFLWASKIPRKAPVKPRLRLIS